jgi:3-oxoacyl-[acyl-carrier protein] reductase
MNKTVLITGGSRGIGFGIARCLAEAGYDVAINGVRDESAVQGAMDELKSFGVRVVYCQGDISKSEDRQGIILKIEAEFGKLNFLINNAGVAPKVRNDILEATEESFERLIKINLQGPYFLTQSFAKRMIGWKKEDESFEAAIVNVTSISSDVASVARGEYCVSKAGLSMITKLFAVRLGEYNIPVYEIKPGIIKTDMTSGVIEKYDKLIFEEDLLVQSRWGMPEDIGKVCRSLVSGDLAYSTGQVINVDGGFMLPRL